MKWGMVSGIAMYRQLRSVINMINGHTDQTRQAAWASHSERVVQNQFIHGQNTNKGTYTKLGETSKTMEHIVLQVNTDL